MKIDDDITEHYVRIDGIGVASDCFRLSFQNEYERLKRGSPVFSYCALEVTARTKKPHKPAQKTHNLYDVILKAYHRNGNVYRFEIKDAFLYTDSSKPNDLTFILSHVNDDNYDVMFY